MEAAVRTMTISLPAGDVRMAKHFIQRMGWAVVPAKPRRKTGLELAIEDEKAGRIHHYNSLDELKAKFAHV